MEKNRITWIDTAKGLGIFLVVLGHNSIPAAIFGYIFSFHMPLFFFISGFLFKKDLNFSNFAAKKFKTLILPYLTLGLGVYLYWLVIYQKFSPFDLSLLKPLGDLAFASTKLESIFTPLWFLPGLFVAELIFFAVIKKFPKQYLLISLILSLIGYWNSFQYFKNLPWSITASLVALVFMAGGYFLKDRYSELLGNIKLKKTSFLLLIPLITLSFSFFYLNGTIDMLNSHYQNYLFFLLSALGGIGMIMVVSWRVKKVAKPINFLGRNSLIILAFHSIGILIGRATIRFIEKQTNLSIPDEQSLIFGLTYSLFAIILILPIIYLINNYLPMLVGRRKP